jgi:hypothetical protein
MKFLYRKYAAKKGQCIEVELSAPATVKFMTASEFKRYAGGRTHTYFKGRMDDGTVRIALPFDSVWHAVVENGGSGVTASTRLRASAPAQLLEETYDGPGDGADMELQDQSRGNQSEG